MPEIELPNESKLTVTEEIEALKKKCLKKDGDPRADAKVEDLQRLMTLQNKPPDENDRLTVEKKGGKDVISVTKGRPMTLEGFHKEDEKWKVIAVISSNGAKGVKVRCGIFTDYRLDGKVSIHMQHDPPKVSMKPQAAQEPKIIE